MSIARRYVAFALIALLATAACSSPDESVPARPGSVPASAVWVGGVDGGVFVDIASATGGEYRVRIFLATGEPEVDGVFVPSADTPPAATIDASSVSGWDGEQLLLDGGGALVQKPGA